VRLPPLPRARRAALSAALAALTAAPAALTAAPAAIAAAPAPIAAAPAPIAVSAAAASLTIGALAPDGAESAERAWEPTRAHLAATLCRPVVLRSFDLPSLREAVSAGAIDFFVANSGFYVEMEVAHGASRIATLDAPPALSPTRALASAIVVRADRRDVAGLAELRGKRVATAGTDGFGGWQVAWGEFARAGLDPRRDFATVDETGFPMRKVLDRVAAGTSDAGVVRACLIEALAARGELDASRFRVLAPAPADGFACVRSTPLYPDWPFATVRHVPADTAKAVASALLAMPRTPGGTAWTIPTDYRRVHELLRELGIGPYETVHAQPTLGELARRYWWIVAMLAALAAGGLLHNLRVEWTVKRRTRELRAALDAQQRLALEAQAQQRALDHLARLGILGEMASMLAHELNQPLATIGNFARGIVRMIEGGRTQPAPLVDAANEISQQAERAAGVLQRIRGFARKRPAERAAVDLAEVAAESIALFRGMVPDAPAVQAELHPSRVRADRLQLEQVILNLLKNAYDATRSQPDDAPAQVRVECGPAAGHARLAVVDNGSGLGDADRERLFEPFFTTKPQGLGLGLAISLRVIESHGGRLFADAAPGGRGLAVGFLLPLEGAPS